MTTTATSTWVWPRKMQKKMRPIHAAILWELYLGGPAVSQTGKAPFVLADRVNKRMGAEVLNPRISPTKYALLVLAGAVVQDQYDRPLVIRETNAKRTTRLALADWVNESNMPPNPFPTPAERDAKPAAAEDELDDDAWIARKLGHTPPAIPVPGEGAARLKQLLTPDPVELDQEKRTAAAIKAQRNGCNVPGDKIAARESAMILALNADVERAQAGPDPEPEPEPELDSAIVADLERRATSGGVLDRLVFAQQAISESLLDIARLEAEAAAALRQRENDPPAERLAAALDENARLRRKLADATETAVARVNENKALQATVNRLNGQIARLQSNLDAALKGERVGDTSGYRAIDTMMRERPKVRATG